jgi:hypothetical protein
MSDDFFSQLELELGGLTREGKHLGQATARSRRRTVTLLRRAGAILVLAIALAASLVGEFPATAGGYTPAVLAAAAHGA